MKKLVICNYKHKDKCKGCHHRFPHNYDKDCSAFHKNCKVLDREGVHCITIEDREWQDFKEEVKKCPECQKNIQEERQKREVIVECDCYCSEHSSIYRDMTGSVI
jgi:hypothetical protein